MVLACTLLAWQVYAAGTVPLGSPYAALTGGIASVLVVAASTHRVASFPIAS